MVEHWNDVVEQCEMVWYNSVEQYGGTVEQCGGTGGRTVEQCGRVWWNSVEQYGGTVKQYG